MSTHAIVRENDPLAALRWLDVVVLVAAAPLVLLAGLPVLGFAVGAAAWLVGRFGGDAIERRGRKAENPRTIVFATMATALGRAWFVGACVLAVGLLGAREDGLTAAILVLVVFTIYLATTVLTKATQRKPK